MSRRRRRKNRHTYVHTASDGKRERERKKGLRKYFVRLERRGVARQTMLALLKEHFFDPCIHTWAPLFS